MIKNRHVRYAILGIISFGMVIALTQISIGTSGWTRGEYRGAVNYLVEYYLPLIGVLVGFYFAQGGRSTPDEKEFDGGTVILGLILVTIFAVLPPISIYMEGPWNDTRDFLDIFNVKLGSIVLVALSFMFNQRASSSRDEKPSEPASLTRTGA
jgi:hypothetical protein